MLDALPDDHEAAEHLVHLYATAREWQKVAESLGVVVRKDCERAAALLLQIAPGAVAAGAHDELASMVDEVVVLLPYGSACAHDVLRAKARALAASPERHAQASEAYRALLQASGGEDDRREYEAHIASTPDAMEIRREHRWLYQWRAANEVQACEPLLAWAKEEEEHGDIELAISILRRALAESPGRKEVLEPLCRLVLRTGDFVGALDALEALTDASGHDERLQLGSYVASLLETGATCILTGAFETRPEIALFERVVRVSRELDQLEAVVLWYGHALRERVTDAVLADAIGHRLAALEGECALEPSFFAETLEHVLELVPGAKWALDRVKLALAAQGRWDDYFRMIDRALETVEGRRDRAELLHEAAFAARDVANDPRRATTYLGALCEERPDDMGAALALEHLYERQGRKLVLAEFLARRAERSTGAARRELQRRIVSLRLELGAVDEASATVDAMLDGGADVAALCDLLEQLARHPGQERAVDRLRAHYEGLGRLGDCARLVEASLDRPIDDLRRAALARDLVRLRVRSAAGAPGPFVRAAERVQLDAAKRPILAGTMHRALVLRAIAASKRAPTDADFDDGIEAAWRAIDAWTKVLLEANEVTRACRVLRRGAGLPFERTRRRELLGRAAELSMDRLDDATQAIRYLEEIFREDSADAVAAGLVDRFASVLRAEGREDRLANLWEKQAGHAGDEAKEHACWRLAAEAWERAECVDRAIAAYDRAADLGSEEAFEALARIHAEHASWPRAAAALEWLYAHAIASSRARHALRLADAYVQLEQRDRARTCLEQVLCGATDAADVEAVRTMLVELYRHDAAWRPLADTLATLARTAASAQRSVALFREAASILRSELEAPAEAAELLALAVATNPADAAVRYELAQVLESLKQWGRAAGVLRDRIALFGEHRSLERALLHHRLAHALLLAKDPAGAFAQLRLASKMQPGHPGILHDLAKTALEVGDVDLAEQTYRALLLALRNTTDASVSTSSAQVLLELAKISLQRGKAARAADLADSALQSALDAGDDPRPFERMLREMARQDLLVSTLTHQLEWSGDVTARCGALRDLVDLWRSDLHQEPELGALLRRSARTLRSDLERERITDGAAWAALWSAHASLGEEASLLEAGDRIVPVLHEAIDGIEDAPDRARLRVTLAAMLAAQPAGGEEAAALLATALGETDDAETARRIAQELEALGSPRVADALEVCLTLDPKAARSVAPRLATLREQQGEPAGVVRALEMLFATDPARGTAPGDRPLLRRLVAAYESLGTEPEAIGLERMASLAVDDGAWDRAGAIYARMMRAWAPTQGTGSLVRAASRLLEACERAGRPGDAREPLEDALRRASGHAEIERALERVYKLTSDWTALAALLAARAERVSEVTEKAALLLRAATILVDHAGDPSAALPWIEQARKAHPESLEANLLWAKLLKASGRTREALGALEDAVSRARGKRSPALAGVYLEMGRAYLAGDDLVEAFDALKSGFAIDWHCGELALLLGLLALDMGDDKIAERALLAVAMAAPRKEGSSAGATDSEKLTAYHHLAALAQAQGDLVKARRWADRAANDEPTIPHERTPSGVIDTQTHRTPVANVANR
jgi:tetratricopeptide (TPR) repeat protein